MPELTEDMKYSTLLESVKNRYFVPCDTIDPTWLGRSLFCGLIQTINGLCWYLRSHSWYADTLGLDYQSLRIPHFIYDIQTRLQDTESWCPEPIELVPAPKNQRWRFRHEKWEPCENIAGKSVISRHIKNPFR